MRELVDAKSAAEGRNVSRLPSFNAEWTQIINGNKSIYFFLYISLSICFKGSLDFIGLNHYTTQLVFPTNGDNNPGIGGDSNTGGRKDPNWEESAADWLRVVPWG